MLLRPHPLLWTAIENTCMIRFAYHGKDRLVEPHDHGILNGSVQVAIALTPALVIISIFVGVGLTLILSPLLLAALTLATLLTAFIVFDGESTWLEGATLIALYAIIATAFWWG